MEKYWLRERNSNPVAWCPYQMPATVITGLTVIADQPPGIDAGWFCYASGGIDITLHKAVEDEIRTAILEAQ